MLIPVEDGPAVVACNTCRLSKDAREDETGQRGGARRCTVQWSLHANRHGISCTRIPA